VNECAMPDAIAPAPPEYGGPDDTLRRTRYPTESPDVTTNRNALQHVETRRERAPLPRKLLLATLGLGLLAPLICLDGRSGSAPPEMYQIFERLFFFNDYRGALAMQLGLLLALVWAPLRDGVERLAQGIGAHPARACALAFVALAAGARFVYFAHPYSMDEYAPVLQAHAFAHGDLAAHYPPTLLDRIVVPFFQGWFVLVNHATGDAASAYWPGLALLLAPFARLHLEWMLNPALSALALWLIGDLAARAGGDPRCRGWAMLAALASPAFTVNAMSFYAMPGLLALNLLFLWLLLRPGGRAAFAAGLVGSLALVLHNPVPHALMAVTCGVWLLAGRERRLRLVPLVAGYLPLTLLLAIGWPMLTGSLGLARLAVVGFHGSGFVAEWTARLSQIFTLPTPDVILHRWFAAWKVWIWAAPGMLLLPFALRRRDTTVKLLIAAFVLTFAFYFLVRFDQGHGWAYRYVHPMWAVLPVCAGIWIALADAGGRAFGAAMVAAGLLATPMFLWDTHATIAHSLDQRLDPPADEHQYVVFITLESHMYTADLVQNLPGETRVLRLASKGDDLDRRLILAMSPRAVEIAHDPRGSLWRLPEPAR